MRMTSDIPQNGDEIFDLSLLKRRGMGDTSLMFIKNEVENEKIEFIFLDPKDELFDIVLPESVADFN